ncbi:SusC/RagA family TonB-linked outer membrane protein [Bacteroides ovatus]|uniref:TonB-linked outer membrane protein, SusC/RagA family n=1 Tax=Bacteroides ovatus TaxID=28116 RepID=A0A1G8CQB8_BACOV|nr:SusC/RagA family TonB-linked outer membrane protein [Bacteroides ovatus]SDH47514.1 TonB-linked outer membrane protein, SusC/RagA family [Bacteroides ovatus]
MRDAILQMISDRISYPLKFLFSSILLLLFIVPEIKAQDRILTGTVFDDSKEPMMGVTVMDANTKRGTVTDINGKYSLKIPASTIVQFSFIGYKTKAVNVSKTMKTLDVTLVEDAIMLEQTVVTAMDMRRDEKSLSTAFQKLDVEGMTENRNSDFLGMLSGKVAGLQVISNGAAGSASIRIRGTNSITGNNDPLYVIDGIPIMNNSGMTDSGIDYGNPANSLNPDNIESIVVLKGANAAALYGSDAANGAIVITTRKAQRKNGMGISFSSNFQLSYLYQYPMYQNVYGSGSLFRLQDQAFNVAGREVDYDPNFAWGINKMNNNKYNNYSWGVPMIGMEVVGRNGELKTYSPHSDNITSMYGTAHTWTNTVTVEKRTEEAGMRLAYTNLTSDDILSGLNDMTRNQLNLHLDFKPVKYFNVDLNANYQHENTRNRTHRNNSEMNPIYLISSMPRDISIEELTPWKMSDGTAASFNGFRNPLWMLNELANQDKRHAFRGDVSLNFQLMKDLKLRVKAAIDYNARNGWEFRNLYTPGDWDGLYKEFVETARNYNFEAMLNYNKHWKKFNLVAMLGASMQDYQWEKLNSEVATLLHPDIRSLGNNGANMKTYKDYNAKKKQALFGTGSLGYNNFIYLDLTGRNDWSSSLPASNWSYFYYSIGTSFVLTEVYKKIPKKILSYAKFRASFASVGNDAGFDNLFAGLKYGNTYLGTMSYFESEGRKRNPRLKPESTASWEFGTDLRFWDNRITVDFTYYNKTTKDQIVNSDVDGISGYSSAVLNAGKVRNWGTELAIGVTPIRNKDFEWKVNINWAKNNSKILELNNDAEFMKLGGTGTAELRLVKGHSFGSIFAGGAKRDENGYYLVDTEGQRYEEKGVFLGDVSPKWLGGVRTTFRWRDLTASVLFDIKVGGKVWSGSAAQSTINGLSTMSMEGRDEFWFSQWVLNENDTERAGYLNAQHTSNGQGVYHANMDKDRPKGVWIPNAVYNSGNYKGEVCEMWISPEKYFCHQSGRNGGMFLYDASYVKLREVSIGYNFPRKILNKIGFLQSMKISAVGRNLAILHQNTPDGIDPEATMSIGSAQGLENGFNLPSATYGFDLKLTF